MGLPAISANSGTGSEVGEQSRSTVLCQESQGLLNKGVRSRGHGSLEECFLGCHKGASQSEPAGGSGDPQAEERGVLSDQPGILLRFAHHALTPTSLYLLLWAKQSWSMLVRKASHPLPQDSGKWSLSTTLQGAAEGS